jgi:iron complex transport system ATP-binding protein
LTSGPPPILEAVDATCGFARRPDFLKPVRLTVARGECCSLIGPNGAGKSTLLRLLAGLLTPTSGSVLLDGQPLVEVPPRRRARRLALLPQHCVADLQSAARDVVLMGRFPHRRFGLFEQAGDLQIAEQAMTLTETSSFADRPLSTLSGGEAQRVHIAAAIAQQPAALLLDEPTASLDLNHQLAIFAILRQLAEEHDTAVIVATHDVNLAARFCSKVLLLDEGRPIAAGPPREVIRPEVLEPVYGVELVDAGAERLPERWLVPFKGGRAVNRAPQGPRDETPCS